MSFLGALGAVGRLLPGYMQGERQAVQDNWNDLNQYNKVQAGQLQNMFDENVMRPRMQMVWDTARQQNYGTTAMEQDLFLRSLGLPRASMQEMVATANFWPNQAMKQNLIQQLYGAASSGGIPVQGKGGQQGNLLQQLALGGLGGWQYGLGGGGYGQQRLPSRYF